MVIQKNILNIYVISNNQILLKNLGFRFSSLISAFLHFALKGKNHLMFSNLLTDMYFKNHVT